MNKLFTIPFVCLLTLQLFAQESRVSQQSTGVVVYQFRPGKGELVKIYKANGSLLRQLTVDDNLLDDAVIDPLAMKGENFLLVFDCLGATATDYKVIANDKTKSVGYIRKADPHFKFKTWPDFIVALPAVDFDHQLNPLHRLPDAKSPKIKHNADDLYHPKLIKGDWLNVYGDKSTTRSGWVRWRDKRNSLLIELLFDM